MLNKLRSKQGFTLIELLIVVAIIGILAAIAIPQFTSYRQKSFNAAAVSDLKNMQTAQANLSGDNTFGWSEAAVTLAAAVGTGGGGAILTGPVVPSTIGVAGAAIAGLRADATVASQGVGVSNGVIAFSNTIAMNAPNAYIMGAKHTQGTRVYEVESGSTATMFVQNDLWAGTAITGNTAGGLTPACTGFVAAATPARVITPATAGGGAPTANWSTM